MPAAAVAPGPPATLRFCRFELQSRERRLLVDGQPANLGARAFDLLATLAARPDQLVTKSELLDLVWPGLVVEESNLHTQMSALRKVLGGDIIATVPGRGYRFAVAAENRDADVAAAPATAPPAAPAPASAPGMGGLPAIGGRLIGREDDLALVDAALRRPGCATLVGAGGVGKTRLALAVAQRWDPKRVWVDLAPLTEGVQVAGALARALGLSVADDAAAPQLARALAEEGTLLVLDNAEHLIDASSALATSLLAGAPELRLLVTSQVALGLAGERVLHLEPLLIEAGSAAPDTGNGAMALLVDRINAADQRVRIDPANTALVREICHQLDGLPLALEMAAARVPMLGLKGVRDELAQRFALLTKGHRQSAPRHRTLHAALDWSFNLLRTDEQRLFAALGVFAGGFTLDTCVALVNEGADATARWDIIDRLAALVDRSLVAVGTEDPPRYRLLETMRAYALEQLSLSAAAADMRRQHAKVMAAFLAVRAREVERYGECVPELDNVREAIVWAQANDLTTAVSLTANAARVTTFTPWRAQAHAWMCALEPQMDAPAADALPGDARAAWWNEYARAAIVGIYRHAGEIAQKARRIARAHRDPLLEYQATVAVVRSTYEVSPALDEACAAVAALMQAHPEWSARTRLMGQGALATAASRRGDAVITLAERRAEMALALEAGLPQSVDVTETNISITLRGMGRYEEALAHARAVVTRLEGNPSLNLAWGYESLVTTLLKLGCIEEARAEMPRAITVGRAFEIPVALHALAELALRRNRPEAAARLIGYAKQSFDTRGMGAETLTDQLQEAVDLIEAEVGAERMQVLVQEGRSLTDTDALDLACGD